MKLSVLILDRWRTTVAIIHENSYVPYGRRVVQIELTPDQIEKIKLRSVGVDRGKDCFEEYGDVWIEPD